MLALLSLVPGVGIAAQVISAVATFLIRCKICMILIAIAIAFVVGDIRGRHVESLKCQAADIAMQLAAVQRDKAIADATAEAEKQRAAQLESDNTELQKQVTDLGNLPPPVASCLLPKGTIDRLEKIK